MRRAMEMFFVILGWLALMIQVHGQPGFMSIDCGMTDVSDYNDATTNILYTSDAKFINTGTDENITSIYSNTVQRPLSTVRSFSHGDKNCYTLVPEQGKNNKYLIRASFMYGNYDSKDQLPVFKLYLGVEEWDVVKFNNNSDIVFKEIIHIPSTDYINVCLVNNGSGTPFISALELRQLNNSIYKTQSGSLMLYGRYDVGSTTNQIIRYEDDVYDRIWKPFSWTYWVPISASYTSDLLSANEYKPPPTVMRTAVIPANGTPFLKFYWLPNDPSQQFYVYLHFAEVQDLRSDQLRKFDIFLNGDHLIKSLVPTKSPITVESTYSVSGEKLTFLINMTSDSTFPPILNAMEIYMMKKFQQSPTNQDDVIAIKDIQSVYTVERNWQGDPCVPKEYLWDGLVCSDEGYNSPSIISLNLSSSGLTGNIASSLFSLKSLQYLDLSYNSLTGQVPDFLSQLTNLRTLNLSGNQLTGSVPSPLIERSMNKSLSLSVDGNPGLCSNVSCQKNNKKNIVVPVVASVASLLVLMGALVTIWILKRRRKHALGHVAKSNGDAASYSKSQKFSYSEVLSITNDFEKVIGKGGFGTVYGGQLKDGTRVAVKMLSPSSTQGSKQFQTEARLLTRIHHRNLAPLIGYCDEGSHIGLIYEYMVNGNLREHLSGSRQNAAVLSWQKRLSIAVDAAQALEYLHEGCKPPIIHRDVKTDNILLNEKMQARVADFGLSRILPLENGSHVSTAVAGTLGYLDPEYYISNRLNEKSDVYSFGIVLLELITGQPAIVKSNDSIHIVQWINPMLERGDIRNIVDPRLQGDFDINSVWKAVETAVACVPSCAIQRPTMSDVLVELKQYLEMEVARKSTWSMKEDRETTSSNFSRDLVPLDIETSLSMSIGPQAR